MRCHAIGTGWQDRRPPSSGSVLSISRRQENSPGRMKSSVSAEAFTITATISALPALRLARQPHDQRAPLRVSPVMQRRSLPRSSNQSMLRMPGATSLRPCRMARRAQHRIGAPDFGQPRHEIGQLSARARFRPASSRSRRFHCPGNRRCRCRPGCGRTRRRQQHRRAQRGQQRRQQRALDACRGSPGYRGCALGLLRPNWPTAVRHGRRRSRHWPHCGGSL